MKCMVTVQLCCLSFIAFPQERDSGTMPDHAIAFTIEDILNRRDTQFEFVKKRIRGN